MAPRLPMTTATGLGSLPDLLEARAGARAVAQVLAAENLPLQLVTDRSHRMPLVSMIGVFDRAARLVGDPCFGLEVGLAMAPGDYGRGVQFALQAETLGGALSRLTRCIVLHQFGGTLALRYLGNDDLLWGYRHDAAAGSVALQHNDHVVPVMIRVVRAYCGPAWLPGRICAACPDPGDGTRRTDLLQVPWQFDAPLHGIVLPARALRARRTAMPRRDGTAPLSSAEVLAEVRQRRAETLIDRISAIIALRLLDGRTDIDGVAAMTGLGRRSLQRHLDHDGQSYRALLDRVRMDRAKALIGETGSTLAEVAEQVGYSDPAHFTRAFRRRFGVPPSRLRTAMLERSV